MLKRKHEQGQALVEFSLVLPLLAIFTIGSILLGIYFCQRSTMTGVTFIAAREAAMSENPQGAAAQVQAGMAGNNAWLQGASVSAATAADNTVAVTMTHSGDMNNPLLANAGNAVGGTDGRPLDHFGDLSETVLVSSEVVHHTEGGSVTHPRTGNVVDYRYKWQLAGVDVQNLPLADQVLGQVAPQRDGMSLAERSAALSGCAESSTPCPGVASHSNLQGPDGFLEGDMGYNPATRQVDGTIKQKLPQLRDAGNFVKLIQKVGPLKALADPVIGVEVKGLVSAFNSAISVPLEIAENAFSGLSTGATDASKTLGATTPLAQYRELQNR